MSRHGQRGRQRNQARAPSKEEDGQSGVRDTRVEPVDVVGGNEDVSVGADGKWAKAVSLHRSPNQDRGLRVQPHRLVHYLEAERQVLEVRHPRLPVSQHAVHLPLIRTNVIRSVQNKKIK